ncbi:MAG TPA: energy transducer TonB [Bacteroidales bacterium]|nr:energy transducer TonB [Bacteroidales bacterium]HPE56082.1 energy transducer TonB [Bacteroidales bacterium]HRX97670.1 energy transducer TonB [Bacteroidales bacterium]
MQKAYAVFSVVFLLFCYTNFAQDSNHKDVANSSYSTESIVPEKSFDFITQYGINIEEMEIYVTLEDVPIRTKPQFNSGSYDVVIPEGSNVEVYKYLNKQAFYIVHYDDVWGFLPSTTIVKNAEQKQLWHISEVDRQPDLLSTLEVTYPNDSTVSSIEGTVVLKIFISKTGAVIGADVEHSIPGLDEHAIELVKGLKFRPAIKNGKPVEVFQNFPVAFKPGKR